MLALQQMVHEGGAGWSLPHKQKAALNSATALLNDAKKVAHKLAHAMAHQGQQRLYLARVLKSLAGLEPGDTTLVPCCVGGGTPLLSLVRVSFLPYIQACDGTMETDHARLCIPPSQRH